MEKSFDVNKLRFFVRKIISEQTLLTEERFTDIYEFLTQNIQKMTNASVMYVALVKTNKYIQDSSKGKIPNPLYGKLYKHQRFMFPWSETFKNAMRRKYPGYSDFGSRSGTYKKIDGYDIIEMGKSGLYFPIYPTNTEENNRYVYTVSEDGKKHKLVDKRDIYPYLPPPSTINPDKTPTKQLILDKIYMIKSGGHIYTNPTFIHGEYLGPLRHE